MPNSQLLVFYRLGAVRMGLQATSLTIVLLVVVIRLGVLGILALVVSFLAVGSWGTSKVRRSLPPAPRCDAAMRT